MQQDKKQLTGKLFTEIYSNSGKNWKQLYVWLDTNLPGYVSGESHMRQLGSGNRFLSDEKLACVAKLALKEKVGGECACELAVYITPSETEKKKEEKTRRSLRYICEDPVERLIDAPMRHANEERRRCAAMLNEALLKMAPAGYSCVDILYMVNAWLVKTPPSTERGKRQNWIVSAPEEIGPRTFERAIYPESLPSNFVLPEHLDGMPYFIECKVKSLREMDINPLDIVGRAN